MTLFAVANPDIETLADVRVTNRQPGDILQFDGNKWVNVPNDLGTVTNFSFTDANGISGVVTNSTTTPNLTLSLGAITPSSVNGLTLTDEGVGFSISGGNVTPYTLDVIGFANVSGNNTGDITIAGENYLSLTNQILTANSIDLSGSNVTGSLPNIRLANSSITINGSSVSLGGSVTVSAAPSGSAGGDLTGTYPNPSIGTNKVTNAMLRQSAGVSIIGRAASASGDVADITASGNDQVLRRRSNTLSFGTLNAESLNYNTTNFKSDAGVFNTIQNIDTSANVTFAQIQATSGFYVPTLLFQALDTGTVFAKQLNLWNTANTFSLGVLLNEAITADRTLSIISGDANRTITFSGNPTLGDWFNQSVKDNANPTFNGVKLLDISGNNTLNLVYNEDTAANTTLNLALGGLSRTLTFVGNPTIGDYFDQAVKSTSSPQFKSLGLGSAPISTAIFYNAESISSNFTSSLYGNLSQPSIFLNSGATSSIFSNYYGSGTLVINSGASVDRAAVYEAAAISKSGAGTLTSAYGGYFVAQTAGATSNTALYAANLAIGYTAITPPSNGLIVQGRSAIGTNSSDGNHVLTVSSSSFSGITVSSGTGGGATGRSLSLGVSGGVSGSPQLLMYANANTNGAPYVIQAARSGLANDAPLVLNPSGGNVGIGTTPTATQKLLVNGIFSLMNASTQNLNGGVVTEANTELINIGMNEDAVNRFGGSYTSSKQGGLFRVDCRTGSTLFTWLARVAGGTGGVAQKMSLTSEGALTVSPTSGGFSVDVNGNIINNSGTLGTSATNGFTYVSNCSGVPSGTPAVTSATPLFYDKTNNRLYAYNTAWKYAQFV